MPLMKLLLNPCLSFKNNGILEDNFLQRFIEISSPLMKFKVPKQYKYTYINNGAFELVPMPGEENELEITKASLKILPDEGKSYLAYIAYEFVESSFFGLIKNTKTIKQDRIPVRRIK